MKPRWRLTALVSLVAVGAMLVAWSTAASGANAHATAGKASKLTVAGVVTVGSDPDWITFDCAAKREAKKLGINFKWVTSPTADPTVEAQNLRTVELQHPDGVLLQASSATAFVLPVKQLMDKGVPVNLISGAPLAKPVFYQSFATSRKLGISKMAHMVARQTGGKGSVLVLAGLAGSALLPVRGKPFIDALAKVAPHLTVLPVQYDNIDTTTAATITSSEILAHPDLKAVYAVTGPEAIGAISAVEKHGDRSVKVYGYDATPPEVAAVRRGTMAAAVSQAPAQAAVRSLRSIVSYLRAHPGRKPVPAKGKTVTVPSTVITKANVNKSGKPFEYVMSCSALPPVK